MAGASDKARFYLEQAVPELREWERREIFSKVSALDLGLPHVAAVLTFVTG